MSEGGVSEGAKGGGGGEGAATATATATATASPPSGETTVGPAFAEAELRPVGDSGTHGTAVFKGVGSTDVQVELDVSGLPAKDPDALYFAQVHEGSCSDEHSDEPSGEGHEEHSAVAGPTLALLVRFDRLLAEGAPWRRPQAHRRTAAMSPASPRCPPVGSTSR